MAELIIMPKLGFNMSEGKIIQWYKKEGETITKGDALLEIETDKTAIDIEATRDGVLLKILADAGGSLAVTLPIAVIGKRDENIDNLIAEANLSPGLEKSSTVETDKTPSSQVSSDYDYDIIVIGSGPGGYVAAIKAAQLGKKTALIEKEYLGGTCLNVGCIPTKALLKSAEVFNEIRHSENFGIEGIDFSSVKLNQKKMQARKNSIVKELVSGVDGLLKKNSVTLIKGIGEILDKNTVKIEDKKLTTENIVIATGSEVKNLPIAVDPAMHFSTSKELLEMDTLPENTVIIGGGVIGIEFAYYLASLGCKVTIIEFLDRILAMTDEAISAAAHKKLESMGIKIITKAKVTEVKKDSVLYEKDDLSLEVKTEHVLMAVGRVPNTSGVPADKLGLKTDRGAITTDSSCRTSVPNIFAIGDVNGKSMLAHTASMEGITAVETICGQNKEMDYGKIPGVVFINPEIAWVGMTETEAKKENHNIGIGISPLFANGKSKIEGDDTGFIKVITDKKYNEILGVHIFGLHAADMITEGTASMVMEGTADEIINTIHPHPTVSEAIHEAFHAAVDKAIHF